MPLLATQFHWPVESCFKTIFPSELTAAPAEETILPATKPKTPKQQHPAPSPESVPKIISKTKMISPRPNAENPAEDNQFLGVSVSDMNVPKRA